MIDTNSKIIYVFSRTLLITLFICAVLTVNLSVATPKANAEFKRGENPSPVSGTLQSNAPSVSPSPDASPTTSANPSSSTTPETKSNNTNEKVSASADDERSPVDTILWLIGGGVLLAVLLGGTLWFVKKKK